MVSLGEVMRPLNFMPKKGARRTGMDLKISKQNNLRPSKTQWLSFRFFLFKKEKNLYMLDTDESLYAILDTILQ